MEHNQDFLFTPWDGGLIVFRGGESGSHSRPEVISAPSTSGSGPPSCSRELESEATQGEQPRQGKMTKLGRIASSASLRTGHR